MKDKQVKDVLDKFLKEPRVDLPTTMFFVEEARFFEYIEDLMLENGVASKTHFMEVLTDHAGEIADKFDEVSGNANKPQLQEIYG